MVQQLDEAPPIILTGGDPHERGYQHGAQARERVEKSVDRYRRVFSHYAGLNQQQVREAAQRFEPVISGYDPALLEEIRGVAEGAQLPLSDILAVNVRSELMFGLGVPECTSFALLPSTTANAHTLIGQNWDWTPEAGESLIILVVKQEPLPTVVLLTEAGMIGRLGFNSAGIGLMTNTLITDQRQIGVPYNIVLRGILNGRTMGDSIGAVLRAERAIAANYLIAATGGEAIDLEAAPDTLDYLYPQDGILTHGNHFASRQIQVKDLSRVRFPDSLYRDCRLRTLLAAKRGAIDVAHIQKTMGDHFGQPDAICRHPDTRDPYLEQINSLASMIVDLDDLCFWVTNGPPCSHRYHRFDLNDLLAGAHKPTPEVAAV